jgi:hypothetical protein
MKKKWKRPSKEELKSSIHSPGNIQPSQFVPVVMSCMRDLNRMREIPFMDFIEGPVDCKWKVYDPGWVDFLVCWKRMMYSENLMTPSAEQKDCAKGFIRESKLIYFPVAIVLQHPAKVLYGFRDDDPEVGRDWIVKQVSEFGLGELDASAALAAAWRGFRGIRHSWPERGAIQVEVKTPWLCLENDPIQPKKDNVLSPQELTQLRDVALWTNWKHWDTFQGPPLNCKERAKILTNWGYPCTETAVRRVKEKVFG